MEQGISQLSLAERLGVHETTIVNWEIKGKIPRFESHIKILKDLIPGTERFFEQG